MTSHAKNRVWWTNEEWRLVLEEVARLFGDKPVGRHGFGPYIDIAQANVLPPDRRRSVHNTKMNTVVRNYLRNSAAPGPQNPDATHVATDVLQDGLPPAAPAKTRYRCWARVLNDRFVAMLEENRDLVWKRENGAVWVIEAEFGSAEEFVEWLRSRSALNIEVLP